MIYAELGTWMVEDVPETVLVEGCCRNVKPGAATMSEFAVVPLSSPAPSTVHLVGMDNCVCIATAEAGQIISPPAKVTPLKGLTEHPCAPVIPEASTFTVVSPMPPDPADVWA